MSSSDLGDFVGNAIQGIHVQGERARLEEIISNLRFGDEAVDEWDRGYDSALDDILTYIRRP